MDWLARQARAAGDALALSDDRSALSYGELASGAMGGAGRLKALGLAPGSTLLWEAQANCASLVGLHAAFIAGVTIAPYRPGLGQAAKRALAERIQAVGQLSVNGEPLGLPGMHDLNLADLPDAAPSDSLAAVADPERVATLLQTSGSGGPAKLVPLRWRHHQASVEAIVERLGLSANDRWLACLPLHHIGGLAIVLRAVFTGAAVTLHDHFDVRRLVAALQHGAITHLSLVPTQLRRLVAALERPLAGSLRCVLIGGAPAEPALMKRARALGLPVVPTWGMTEAGSQLVTSSLAQARSIDFVARPGLVGRPLAGVELRLARGAADSGELEVRAPFLFEGYVDCPGGPDGSGWFATGDRGLIDEDGWVRITGRNSDRIISGGENVDPRKVERALREAGLVDEACVLGLPDADWGEQVAAVVVSHQGDEALARWAGSHLEPHERPRQWRIVERLPRTDSGKPDRRAIRRLFER
jgi:O-succinylbenzoic acid--CoA ligase